MKKFLRSVAEEFSIIFDHLLFVHISDIDKLFPERGYVRSINQLVKVVFLENVT